MYATKDQVVFDTLGRRRISHLPFPLDFNTVFVIDIDRNNAIKLNFNDTMIFKSRSYHKCV